MKLEPLKSSKSDDIAAVGLPPLPESVIDAFKNEFDIFLDALPEQLSKRLRSHERGLATLRESLVEVIADVGEPVRLCMRNGENETLDIIINADAMEKTRKRWQRNDITIGKDKRVALAGTLHRISVKFDRNHEIDGLTCRVGKKKKKKYSFF
jgi:stage III sporulation protein SpoIIIAA